jgi:transaldolase / glucose-6-phosphate isomerase
VEGRKIQTGQGSGLGSYASQIEEPPADLTKRDAVGRIWAKDPSLWKSEPDHQLIIRNSLSWLTVMATVRQHASGLARFVVGVNQAGFRYVLVLTMGGSSLCPDVWRLTFGEAVGFPRLAVRTRWTRPASMRLRSPWICRTLS